MAEVRNSFCSPRLSIVISDIPICSESCQTATTARSAQADFHYPTCNRHAQGSSPCSNGLPRYHGFPHPRVRTPSRGLTFFRTQNRNSMLTTLVSTRLSDGYSSTLLSSVCCRELTTLMK